MLPSRFLPISLTIPILSLTFATGADAQSARVSYTAPRTVVLREPVIVTFAVNNPLPEPIRFDLGFDRIERLSFTVTDPAGRVAQVSPPFQSGVGRGGLITVNANSRYSQRIVMSEWLSFDQIGEYHVAITPQAQIETGSGEPLNASLAGAVRITIHPRNEPRLQEVCRQLVDTVQNAASSADRGDAVRAFRTIADPAAVPFVRELLSLDDAYDQSMFRLLLRIGTPDARAVIDEATHSNNSNRALIARTALTGFDQRKSP